MSACQPDTEHPNIKFNPHPKMRYEITLVIKDAPGPFESITGFMQYGVTNEQCAPFEKFIGIYRTPRSPDPEIQFTKTGDDEYKGTLYLDLLQDEDYYKLGICHWSMEAAIVRLKIQEATFSPDMSQKQIVSQKPVTIYFPKRGYGDTPIKNMHYAGSTMSEIIYRYRDEFFSVTLSAKEQF